MNQKEHAPSLTVKCLEVPGRRIGAGHPCFIIAEAGVNHNGSLELAERLVDAAHAAGADAIKFQTWVTEKVAVPGAPAAEYQRSSLDHESSQFALLKQLELEYGAFRALQARANGLGILFLSTPDEEDSADFLDSLNVPLYKIGSGEITNHPFLRHVASKQKPMILSTGMSTLAEVGEAISAFEAEGNSRFSFLHCVSSYTAKPADCNLRALETLGRTFHCPVGFSDHTVGREISMAAVALGACIIEKHMTLDRAMAGPDHAASMDAVEFGRFVQEIRAVESSLGDGVKRPAAPELEIKKVVQKCLVASRDLPAGHVLAESDLARLRAAGGLSPAFLDAVRGRRLRHPLAKHQIVGMDALEPKVESPG